MAPPTNPARPFPRWARRLAVLTAVLAGCPQAPSATDPAPPSSDLAVAAREAAPEKPAVDESALHMPELGLLRQPLPRLPSEGSVYAVADFPQHTPALQDGTQDDRRLVEVYCVGCHSTTYISMQPPLGHERWEAEVKKMISSYGAMVPEPISVRIATYLHAYYGDNPPPPRKRPPPPAGTAASPPAGSPPAL